MSEYANDEGSPPRHGNDSNLHNISLEDPANNVSTCEHIHNYLIFN